MEAFEWPAKALGRLERLRIPLNAWAAGTGGGLEGGGAGQGLVGLPRETRWLNLVKSGDEGGAEGDAPGPTRVLAIARAVAGLTKLESLELPQQVGIDDVVRACKTRGVMVRCTRSCKILHMFAVPCSSCSAT